MMKTAISIEDEIFLQAEQTAKEMGLSRSKFYSRAVVEFIQNHKADAITAKYNMVYSENSSTIDNDIAQSNFDIFNKEDW